MVFTNMNRELYEKGYKKAKQTDSKYQVPRYIIYKNTSLESFIKMVSN